jgi:hypothetical protein
MRNKALCRGGGGAGAGLAADVSSGEVVSAPRRALQGLMSSIALDGASLGRGILVSRTRDLND